MKSLKIPKGAIGCLKLKKAKIRKDKRTKTMICKTPHSKQFQLILLEKYGKT
jgi:hypothetical protein